MTTDDEILATLKQILAAQEAAQEASREMWKDSQRRLDENHARIEAIQARSAAASRNLKFARYFSVVMAVIVLSLIAYVIFKIESLPPPRLPPR